MKYGELSIDAAFCSGKTILKARSAIAASRGYLEEQVGQLAEVLKEVEDVLGHAPTTYVSQSWKILRSGLSVLVSQGTCLLIAHTGAGELATEQTRLGVLHRELQGQLKSAVDIVPSVLDSQRRELCENAECDAALLSGFLLALPLPLIYWKATEERSVSVETGRMQKTSPRPLVRIIAFLDVDQAS